MPLIDKLKIESDFTPPIIVNDPFGASKAPPSFLMSLLRPKLTAYIGDSPIEAAPYGEPSGQYWPWIQIGTVIVAAILILLFAVKK